MGVGKMDAYGRFLSAGRFGSLDGLRALSILAVLWHHSGMAGDGLSGRGQYGVHLFFAISGFLITSLLIRERQRTGTISMAGFYARRSLRIFPLYYAVLLVYVVLVALVESGPERSEFFGNLPYFATYTSNWFVQLDERTIFFFAWSLATEEQFYTTWPWVERYARPAVRRVLLGGLVALVAAVHFGLILTDAGLLHTIIWSVSAPILFGVTVAHLLHTRRGFAALNALLGRTLSAPLALAAVVGLLAVPIAHPALHYAVSLALVALVTSCVIREDNGLARMLKLRPLVRLGIVSYGIYLMHLMCFAAVRMAWEGPVWAQWLVGIVLVYGVAELSHATFERFFLRMKKRAPAAPVGAATA